ncbi:exostosin-like 3 [Exaiptasia diaphana]|uniref:glucuronosyl-galactosyl-proteoglycan 4-alpha-N-acetylglucosaminyltransferase n=1 Tax=Exaiptasia diaphana TaxID=2652724 RepID=A0A913WX35_EXADI|nr:exostosin-like 3 [Exaiptasia diaphana]KXJ27657.1 Exostosin-like 3 [Exaiptasia diaphana]
MTRFSFRYIKDNLLFRVIVCLLICAIIGPLITLHHLNKATLVKGLPSSNSFTSRNTLGKDEFVLERLDELKSQINELEKIKLSLSNELRDLEGKRHVIQRDIQKFHETAEKLKKDSKKVKDLVHQAKRDLDIFKLEKTRLNQCPQLPFMKLPKAPDLNPMRKSSLSPNFKHQRECTLGNCFDYSRCPYSGGFSVYIYNPQEYLSKPSEIIISAFGILKESPYFTSEASKACVYIVIFELERLELPFASLPYWNNGQNHFILKLKTDSNYSSLDSNLGMAFIGQPSFIHSKYRPGFDLILPPLVANYSGGSLWKHAPPQLPAYRQFFLSFEGHTTNQRESTGTRDLLSLSQESKDFHISTNCGHNKLSSNDGTDWGLCGTHKDRLKILKKSTFTLILGGRTAQRSLDSTHVRLLEALQCGSVPVVLGISTLLPFAEVIDWHLASIILPSARITELNALLRTITSQDLLKLRRQGRFLWENYLSTQKSILYTSLSVIRTRLSLPAPPLLASPSPSVFTPSNQPIKNPPDPDAILELQINSPTFTRNLTTAVNFITNEWNSPPGALYSFPSTPFEPMLPSSAPFMNTTDAFEVIAGGKGGSGEPFSRAQGGNYPKEQFTIVMLTYERELVLMESIQRLVGLQYLNKVIVVWNSPVNPSLSLRWPDIGVPLNVIKTTKNSLNNRFIPYDVIETDAILSIDDDVELRHDEILLAFRVWRENRDRIVGFPGRFHAWDSEKKSWLYASRHSCELSLILTGAAFIHRYYLYLYTHWMPETIRHKVDEYMNCEDIAMNYLVSHITRKPPLKVTSRWTFLCSSCPVALWEDRTHFEERDQCMNFFARVFGYMPLLRTQYRADSVLFKTRISSSESKCFKYV